MQADSRQVISPTACQDIEWNLKYNFKNRSVMLCALGLYNKFDKTLGLPMRCGDQQILELIGDAWLRFVVLCKLFQMKDGVIRSPKSINDAATWLLSNDTVLPEIGKKLGLERCIRNIAGKKRYLANYTEAIVGAAVIDDNNLFRSFQLVERLWQPYINTYRKTDNVQMNPFLPVSKNRNVDQLHSQSNKNNFLPFLERPWMNCIDAYGLRDDNFVMNTQYQSEDSSRSFRQVESQNPPKDIFQSFRQVEAQIKSYKSYDITLNGVINPNMIPMTKDDSHTVSPKHLGGNHQVDTDRKVYSFFSAYCSPFEVFQKSVQEVIDINRRSSGHPGNTILMTVLQSSNLDEQSKMDRTKLLISRGASWYATNNDGANAIDVCKQFCPNLLTKLREQGLIKSEDVLAYSGKGNIGKVDSTRPRVMDCELEQHQLDIAKTQTVATNSSKTNNITIVSTPSQVNQQLYTKNSVKHADTPFGIDRNANKIFSTYHSSFEVFQKSVKNAIDINRRNSGKLGNTILMTVLQSSHLDDQSKMKRIKLLISRGASWFATNNHGTNAIAYCKRFCFNLLAELREQGLIKSEDVLGYDVHGNIETADSKPVRLMACELEQHQIDIAKAQNLAVNSSDSNEIFDSISIPANRKLNANNQGQLTKDDSCQLFTSYYYNLESFKQNLEKVKDINCRNTSNLGNTILITVLQSDKLSEESKFDRIKLLLSFGASWYVQNYHGENAITIGLNSYPHLLAKLIRQGLLKNDNNFNINGNRNSSKTIGSSSTLNKGVCKQDIDKANLQTNKDATQINDFHETSVAKSNAGGKAVKDDRLKTKYIFSNYCAALGVFKEKLQQETDINCRNSGEVGNNILMTVLQSKKLDEQSKIERVKLILSFGASWLAKNNNGETAVDVALRSCPNLFATLIEQGLVKAAQHTEMNIVTTALTQEQSPAHFESHTTLDGAGTAITNKTCSNNGSISASAQRNLVKSSTVNDIDEKIDNLFGINWCDFDTFKNLLRQITDVNCRNSDNLGNTILIRILETDKLDENAKIERIKLLVSYGASWYATNNCGKNAIDIAIKACPYLFARLQREGLVKEKDFNVAEEENGETVKPFMQTSAYSMTASSTSQSRAFSRFLTAAFDEALGLNDK